MKQIYSMIFFYCVSFVGMGFAAKKEKDIDCKDAIKLCEQQSKTFDQTLSKLKKMCVKPGKDCSGAKTELNTIFTALQTSKADVDSKCGNSTAPADSDGDGVPDSGDACPTDPLCQ